MPPLLFSRVEYRPPPSLNNVTTQKRRRLDLFTSQLQQRFRELYPDHLPTTDLLSGDVLWLTSQYRVGTHPDADNISKPVWDALRGVAYQDDKQIRRRSSGIVEFRSEIITELDFTNWPLALVAAVEQSSTQRPFQLLCLQLSLLETAHFRFSL
ncbi:MAG: RusA family crossover junction endodeoxyribonuclease [Hymenobacter sp.]|nr:MAG: RusA family crossover junction endodeoxyribonuclease [Hymenobacter sp.]